MIRYVLFGLLVILFGAFALIMGLSIWAYFNTRGMAYFGRSAAERLRFKQQLARYGRLTRPMLQVVGPRMAKPNLFAFAHDGIYFPANSCNKQTVQRAIDYAPQPNDLFVVTQMKCGTTWMQQVAYEVLSSGAGDLGDVPDKHLGAVSPWLEAFNGVSVADAPLIGDSGRGDGGTRLIKTHLPAQFCPYAAQAKYIYVTRHPISCFGSCVDFYRALAGPHAPIEEALLAWFCSDEMWWGSWPDHVVGYWEWAETRPNVLFVHFEEMKADLPAVVRRVAAFLDCALTDDEVDRIVDKSSFAYMKAREEQFEMIPPSFYSTDATFFRSGSAQRHATVDAAAKARIEHFCRTKLAMRTYPLTRFYPELASDLSDLTEKDP